MTETERFLSLVPMTEHFEPYYKDDELLIVSSNAALADPGTARPNMNIVAICVKGKMSMNINGQSITFQANELFVCPPGVMISEPMFTADFEYFALRITNHALQVLLRSYMSIWNQVTYIDKIRKVSLTDRDMMICHKAYQLVKLCLDTKIEEEEQQQMRRDILYGYLSSMLTGMTWVLKQHAKDTEALEKPKQSLSLFNRFLQLLQTTEVKHQTVEHYASELCISTKYLSVICKQNSHKTALQWIQEYTLADITWYLKNTDLSLKEVCNKVGFPNTSFFGKYFREHFHCTPMEYRLNNTKKELAKQAK